MNSSQDNHNLSSDTREEDVSRYGFAVNEDGKVSANGTDKAFGFLAAQAVKESSNHYAYVASKVPDNVSPNAKIAHRGGVAVVVDTLSALKAAISERLGVFRDTAANSLSDCFSGITKKGLIDFCKKGTGIVAAAAIAITMAGGMTQSFAAEKNIVVKESVESVEENRGIPVLQQFLSPMDRVEQYIGQKMGIQDGVFFSDSSYEKACLLINECLETKDEYAYSNAEAVLTHVLRAATKEVLDIQKNRNTPEGQKRFMEPEPVENFMRFITLDNYRPDLQRMKKAYPGEAQIFRGSIATMAKYYHEKMDVLTLDNPYSEKFKAAFEKMYPVLIDRASSLEQIQKSLDKLGLFAAMSDLCRKTIDMDTDIRPHRDMDTVFPELLAASVAYEQTKDENAFSSAIDIIMEGMRAKTEQMEEKSFLGRYRGSNPLLQQPMMGGLDIRQNPAAYGMEDKVKSRQTVAHTSRSHGM